MSWPPLMRRGLRGFQKYPGDTPAGNLGPAVSGSSDLRAGDSTRHEYYSEMGREVFTFQSRGIEWYIMS